MIGNTLRIQTASYNGPRTPSETASREHGGALALRAQGQLARRALAAGVSGRINTSTYAAHRSVDETSTVTGPVTAKPFVVGACP